MPLEEVYRNTKKRANGQCEWTEKVRKGNCFEGVRCDEMEGQPAKHYKGRVHLLKNFKFKALKETEETIIWLCWRHANKNDQRLHKQVKLRGKKGNPRQLSLVDLLN